MLIFKLILVPSIIFLVSLASRRWGSFVAGVLSGMPVIAAPITLLLAMEYGPEFAMSASHATILGVLALSVFCFMYAWSAKVFGWQKAFVVALTAYLLAAVVVSRISVAPLWAGVMSVSVLLLLRFYLPRYEVADKSVVMSKKEIFVRVLASAVLVVIITSAAQAMGPALSGVFAAFPIATSVLAVFTHIYSGKEQVALLLRGLMLGMFSIILFYVSLVSMPLNFSFAMAFGASLGVVVFVQLLQVSAMRRIKG